MSVKKQFENHCFQIIEKLFFYLIIFIYGLKKVLTTYKEYKNIFYVNHFMLTIRKSSVIPVAIANLKFVYCHTSVRYCVIVCFCKVFNW